MKEITKYVADDGKEFYDDTSCINYEIMCNEVNWIEGHLDSRPKDTDYANGGGYIKHDKEMVIQTMKLLLLIIKKYYITDHKSVDNAITEVVINGNYIDPKTTIVTRLIDEMCPRVVQDVWYRFYCMDNDFREWGQPYFAMNPDNGKQIQLNE